VNRDFGVNSLREEVFGLEFKGSECRVNGLGFRI
jgi:hypothetical protein